MNRRHFLYLSGSVLLAGCGAKSGSAAPGTIYTCSMHPHIRQDKPGDCPLCGMKLTPLVPPAHAGMETAATMTVPLTAGQISSAQVQVVEVAPRVLTQTVSIFGEMEYIMNQHRDFSWFYPGRVEALHINYNTTEVSEGQPLLEIYAAEAIADQQAYLQALRDRYLTTFYERDVAAAQVAAMRAKLEQAGFTDEDVKNLVGKKAIKRTLILRAPRTGTIVGPMPHVGEEIKPDQVLFHIVDLSTLWFVGRVFEADLGLLKIGQSIEIETKAHPGKKFSGKLVFIDRTFDEQNRTVMVRFEVPNPRGELLPKLSATGNLAVPPGEAAVAVPASAVIDTGKRRLVYVETAPQTYEPREVSVGRTLGEYVPVERGLKAGEKVVVNGTFLIDAEAQLKK